LSVDSNLHNALKILKELRVTIPGPIDSATGEPVGGHSFRLQASQHSPKDLSLISDISSEPSRIQFDYDRAYELAVLFDEEKSVPSEHNVQSILKRFPDSVEVCNKLDFVILYLRRVHFFTYYLGKRFRDEAHMTVVAPNILRRIACSVTESVTSLDEQNSKHSEENPITDEEGVVSLVDLGKAYDGRMDASLQNLDK
jgi:hypothetical protein